jgi:hypothetical protein
MLITGLGQICAVVIVTSVITLFALGILTYRL